MATAAIIISTGTQYKVPTTEFDMIYVHMMQITDGDHEISENAASWCELASVGEIYEFREGYIEIQDVE